MPDTEKILAANRELAGNVKELSRKIDKIGTRTRSVGILAIVLTLMVAGIIYSLIRSDHANSRSNRIREYQLASCVTGNEQRKAQRDLWGFIFSATSDNAKKKPTPAQVEKLNTFKGYVAVTFADRDCSKVVPK